MVAVWLLRTERHWQVVQIDGAPDLTSVAYGNGRFVATVKSAAALYLSEDGLHWRQSPPLAGEYGQVLFADGGFLLAGARERIASSPDGLKWEEVVLEGITIQQPVFGNGRFLAKQSRTLLTSMDGLHWEGRAFEDPLQDFPNRLAYGDGEFILITAYGNMLRSADGLDWREVPDLSPLPSYVTGVAAGAGRTVATWQERHIDPRITLVDGIRTWAEGADWQKQLLNGPSFCCEVAGPILTYKGPPQDSDVSFNGAEFLIVGGGGSIRRSRDGAKWQLIRPDTTETLRAVTWGAGRWVAVGDTGTVVLSPQGSR